MHVSLSFIFNSWNQHIDVNLKAPAYLTKEFSKNVKGKNNNIINIIDQRVFKLTPFFFSYTLSKTGLYTLTKTSAMELAPNIRVNGIAIPLTRMFGANSIALVFVSV